MVVQLLFQRQIFFQRRLVPEFHGVEIVGHVANLLLAVANASLIEKQIGNLLIRALAIEELEQLPLLRRKLIQPGFAGDDAGDQRLAVLHALAADQLGMKARITAGRSFCRQLGQRDV